MNIILLERMKSLGDLGQQVKVKPGYARNFLLPQGKAVLATKENITYFEERHAELQKQAAERLNQDQARAGKLQNIKVTISAQVGEEGKLYGSIGTMEIITAIKQAGIEVKKQEIRLPNGPIKTVGEHQIEVSLHHGDIVATVNVTVLPN